LPRTKSVAADFLPKDPRGSSERQPRGSQRADPIAASGLGSAGDFGPFEWLAGAGGADSYANCIAEAFLGVPEFPWAQEPTGCARALPLRFPAAMT